MELPSEVPASRNPVTLRKQFRMVLPSCFCNSEALSRAGTQKRPAATEQKRKDMKHRLAMVGFGGMAGWRYDLIQRIDDLEVAGIWDIKEERKAYAEGKASMYIKAKKI